MGSNHRASLFKAWLVRIVNVCSNTNCRLSGAITPRSTSELRDQKETDTTPLLFTQYPDVVEISGNHFKVSVSKNYPIRVNVCLVFPRCHDFLMYLTIVLPLLTGHHFGERTT